MKIAIVHEFLTQMGGAERVLEDLLEIWPDAQVHVLVHNPEKIGHVFDHAHVKTSFINKLPFARRDHRWFLPLMPKAVESFDLNQYDVVLSNTSSFAKGVRPGKYLHICYCHTPTRFLWTEQADYLSATRYPGVVKWVAKLVLRMIKEWDYCAAQRPHFMIANSQNVKTRIAKYYNRDSDVMLPPVDTKKFMSTGAPKEKYFFAASRLQPYKRMDLIVEAFNKLGWPLKISGTGTELEKLKSMAKPNIEFLGRTSDQELRQHYSAAQAFVFAAEEDAGIMVVEAQACGAPVIAYGKGGSLETIIPGVTGEFFTEQTVESLIEALQQFDAAKYNAQEIRKHAETFDKEIFKQKMKTYVEGKLAEFKPGDDATKKGDC